MASAKLPMSRVAAGTLRSADLFLPASRCYCTQQRQCRYLALASKSATHETARTSGDVEELFHTATERVEKPLNGAAVPAVDPRLLLAGCEPEAKTPLRVAILLSGGVDSSLALHLLRRAGHQVTAFYLQIWFQEDFRNFWGACPWEEDLAFCEKVCAAEGVPLNVVPFTTQYWDSVVEDSLAQIKQGRTPNPDVLCNTRVKFGAFYAHLDEHHAGEFDRVASGHYARVLRSGEGGPVSLALTPDAMKDQTYFLAHLKQEQLARAMFPLGCLTKAQVRQSAGKAGLVTQDRRDSQGICFLGKVRFEEFVRGHLGTWPGPLVDEDTGEVVGFHEGYWFYTPGQRKGILLSGGPWYVSRKDCRRNVVYISRQYYLPEKSRRGFSCGDFNWIAGEPPKTGHFSCKTRHGPRVYGCLFEIQPDCKSAVVTLDDDDQGLASGQFAVFYRGETCLGSGKILEALEALQPHTAFASDALQ